MPWVFALVSALVAALVAAAGDRMGHRAARRKLRIGKLRPRTVSTIIAVATGVLISLATYGAMFAFWANFRDALTHYNQVKADLVKAQSELAQAQADKLSAENEAQTKALELQNKQAEADKLSAQISAIDQQLESTSLSLKKTTSLVQEKERLQARLDRNIKDLQAEKKKIEEEKQAADIIAEAKTARAGEAELLLPKGAFLTYERIPAGSSSQLKSIVQRALNRVNIRFSQENISFSPDTEAAATSFLKRPGVADSEDSVLILSAARNLFKGEDLLVAFEARPLPALVQAGDLLMDITIGEREATIGMLGLPQKTLALSPADGAADQYAQILLAAYDRFVEGMSALGFLPQAPSGEWLTPFNSLVDIGGQLTATPRPLKIQIVSKKDADALAGLGECEIYVKSLAPAESPAEPAPEAQPASPAPEGSAGPGDGS